MTRTLFDRLHETVDYAKGICPWDAVEAAIQGDCLPWYDPRFIKGYHQLLFGCFLKTSGWIKGKYYAQLVISEMPAGIDDDLIQKAQALIEGRLPESETWNAGNPYVCTWPAAVGQYYHPWNGVMFRWALAHKQQQCLAGRLRIKASGYRSPRRNIYYS